MNKGDKIIYVNNVLGCRVRRFAIPRYYDAVVTWDKPDTDCFGVEILNGAKDGYKHGSEFDLLYKADKGETWDTPEDFTPMPDHEQARLLKEFDETEHERAQELTAIMAKFKTEEKDAT